MGRVALWIAQATTSSLPAPTDAGPREAMRGGMLGGQGGPGGGPGGGRGEMMRDGARRFAEGAGHHGDDHHWWMVAIGIVIALALIGLFVWAIIAFTKAMKMSAGTTGTTGSAAGPSAKELLDRRLAQGDISPEDYEARKKLLDG